MIARHGGRPPKKLAPALACYHAGRPDESMALLVALTDEMRSSTEGRTQRTLGLAWEVRSQIEFDRGNDEAALQALFTAEEALSADPENRDILGLVQFGIGTHIGEFPQYFHVALDYFRRTQRSLAGIAQYAPHVEAARQHELTLTEESGDWRERRERLTRTIAELRHSFASMPKGRLRPKIARHRANVEWQIASTMFSLGVLLLENGDDAEVEQGLELMCDEMVVTPDDHDSFFDNLVNVAAALDRPLVKLPSRFTALVAAGHDIARRTGDPAHRAAAHFLSGVLHAKSARPEDLEKGLKDALSALADAEDVFASTRVVDLRRAQLAKFDQYRHLALSLSTRLGLASTTGELIESTRPQVLPVPPSRNPSEDELPPNSSSFGEACRVTVGGSSVVADAASSLGIAKKQTVSLDGAIEAVGGPHAWWWGCWFSLGQVFWATRDPAGAWSCGTTFVAKDENVRTGMLALGRLYHREGIPATEATEYEAMDYASELNLMQLIGQATIPPPLRDALLAVEVGTLSLVVAGNLAGIVPLAALAIPGTADTRLVERAIVRVQPPAFLAHLIHARESEPFGPWPLAVACLDPRGDLRHARHMDLTAEHTLTAGALVYEREDSSVRATHDALRAALRDVGRGVNALFFYSGHVHPGSMGGDLSAHLVLDDGDVASAAHFFGFEEDVSMCAPSRVVLSACDSGGASGSGSGEWFGLGAALLVAGARQVIATAWPILDSAFSARFERQLVLNLQVGLDVGQTLRQTQVEALASWRGHTYLDLESDDAALPVIWSAYQSIGVLV